MIETRLFKTSASSDRHTTGSTLVDASFGGWGRESMSSKKGDDATSADLWTRKLTRSDDWRIISALVIFEYFNGESAYRGVQVV